MYTYRTQDPFYDGHLASDAASQTLTDTADSKQNKMQLIIEKKDRCEHLIPPPPPRKRYVQRNIPISSKVRRKLNFDFCEKLSEDNIPVKRLRINLPYPRPRLRTIEASSRVNNEKSDRYKEIREYEDDMMTSRKRKINENVSIIECVDESIYSTPNKNHASQQHDTDTEESNEEEVVSSSPVDN